MRGKVALVIGHTQCVAEGAVNAASGLTEWVFNRTLASLILLLRNQDSFEIKVFTRPRDVHPYWLGLRRVVEQVNAYGPDLAVSMHANAFTSTSTGSEVLYWHSNPRTARLASFASEAFAQALGLKNRGAIPIRKGQRGWYFLAKTACPSILCEPFFISNDRDTVRALYHLKKLARCYLLTMEKWFTEFSLG